MSGVLARHNKLYGRAESSDIDIKVYCPREVMEAGGPLFANVEQIAAVLKQFLSDRIVNEKLDMAKCIMCGYPNCSCSACIHKNKRKRGNSKEGHTCKLQHTGIAKGGAAPKQGWYNDAQKQELLLAWQQVGVNDQPLFHKNCSQSGYYWWEELTQAS